MLSDITTLDDSIDLSITIGSDTVDLTATLSDDLCEAISALWSDKDDSTLEDWLNSASDDVKIMYRLLKEHDNKSEIQDLDDKYDVVKFNLNCLGVIEPDWHEGKV